MVVIIQHVAWKLVVSVSLYSVSHLPCCVQGAKAVNPDLLLRLSVCLNITGAVAVNSYQDFLWLAFGLYVYMYSLIAVGPLCDVLAVVDRIELVDQYCAQADDLMLRAAEKDSEGRLAEAVECLKEASRK